MEAFTPPSRELPEPKHQLLLPTAHAHLFWQVVLLVFGILCILGGAILYVVGIGDNNWQAALLATDVQVKAMLYALASALLLSSGCVLCFVWALWVYVKKYRYKFIIALCAGVFGIILSFLTAIEKEVDQPLQYTANFFLLSFGILLSALSLFYLSTGYSRHLFGAHKGQGS